MSSPLGARLKIDALEKPKANIKLLYILRYLCLAYGKKSNEDTVKIQVPLIQQQLADFAGFTRETATLLLNKLKIQKIISCDQKYYFVNIVELNNLIDDEYDPGLSVNMLPLTPNNVVSRRNIL